MIDLYVLLVVDPVLIVIPLVMLVVLPVILLENVLDQLVKMGMYLILVQGTVINVMTNA